jgi:sortase A
MELDGRDATVGNWSPRRGGRAVTRRHPLAVAVLAMVALNVTVGGARALADEPVLAASMPPPTTAAPTTTTTTVPIPALPEPAEAPSGWTPEPLVEIGTLSIPALDLDAVLYDGVALSTIDNGPSHWPGTAMPGHVGNVVVAGHRITHSHPFRHLDDLVEGDLAILSTSEGSFTYTFTGVDVVTPSQMEITDHTLSYTATFFACHPPGSAAYRIVAHWRLVSAPAPGQPDPTSLPPA